MYMKPRERVIRVIQRGKPDRIPIYALVRPAFEEEIKKALGSVEFFEDKYEFDYAQVLGGPVPFDTFALDDLRKTFERTERMIKPDDVYDLPMTDPDNEEPYRTLIEQIRWHREGRERFVYVQVRGFFECFTELFGLEQHLNYQIEYPEKLKGLYQRLLQWNIEFAMNCIDLDVDMIHVCDDWANREGLLFPQRIWWELLFPYHQRLVQSVRRRKKFVSLHCEGNIRDVIDGIVEIGYDVVHPWEESSGMALEEQKQQYSDKFVIMGGLDVNIVLGSSDYFKIQMEIDRVLNLFKDGGLLLCTTSVVSPQCTIERLTFVYDYIYRRIRELANYT